MFLCHCILTAVKLNVLATQSIRRCVPSVLLNMHMSVCVSVCVPSISVLPCIGVPAEWLQQQQQHNEAIAVNVERH